MANKNDFVSNERLYLDKDDKVVKADDPSRASLLVAKGGSIPRDVAVKYGLVGAESGGGEEGVAVATVEESSDEPGEDGAGNADDLESLHVPELKEIAKKEDVDLTGITLKADIIKAIEEKREEAGE